MSPPASGNDSSTTTHSKKGGVNNLTVETRGETNREIFFSVEKVEEDPAITQRRRGYSQGMSSLGLGDTEAQAVDPTVPVLKISIALVKECLWKEQVMRGSNLRQGDWVGYPQLH